MREIQVHGESVERASAGQRVALNLSGLDKDDVARGDTVAAPGLDATTLRLDARIEIRPAAGRALPSHVRVRVHHGTRESLARLVWLDGVKEVAPRSSGYAQLALAEPLVAAAGDRFVIRDETASRTLGGGVVLLAHAPRHRRSQGDLAPALERLEAGDDAVRLHTVLGLAAGLAVEPSEAAAAIGVPVSSIAALVKKAPHVVALGDPVQLLVAGERLATVLERIVEAVGAFEAGNANLPGVDLEHLRGTVRPVLDAKVFRLVVERLLESGVLRRRGNLVHTSGHAASLSAPDEALASRLLARVVAAAAMPPTLKDLAVELGIDERRALKLTGVLVLRGDLVKVSADLFYCRETLEGIRARLEEHLRTAGEVTAAEFRDLIAASRKYGIPLLDWFDRSGVTIRVGDVRKLRRS
ncbi:MAG: SelB C-terminal domain-containing protein [Candidatus Binatia bacterium]